MDVERCISLAEIEYKSGNVARAIVHARAGLRCDIEHQTAVALRIFIARAYSKLGKTAESNAVYRALLTERNYLPPIIMWLLYNNFTSTDKLKRGLGLVKVFTRSPDG